MGQNLRMKGGRKGWQIVPLAPSISAPGPPVLSPAALLPMPGLPDFAAALMPLAVAHVYLRGSAKIKDQINFLADLGLRADCQRWEWPCRRGVSQVILTPQHGVRALGRRNVLCGGRRLSDEWGLASPSSSEQEREKEDKARSWKRKGEKEPGENIIYRLQIWVLPCNVWLHHSQHVN